jgi:hypothetical protein
VDARRRGVEGFEGASGALEEERPRPSRLRALAHALEQGHGEGLFELADVQADRGLAQVKELGGPREALEPRDLVQGAQVDRIDGHDYQNFS